MITFFFQNESNQNSENNLGLLPITQVFVSIGDYFWQCNIWKGSLVDRVQGEPY